MSSRQQQGCPQDSCADPGEIHVPDGNHRLRIIWCHARAQPGYRTSRSFAFVLTLGIIVVYYVISFSFSSLGVKGTLSPLAAAWLPVLISLGAGGLLLRQASR